MSLERIDLSEVWLKISVKELVGVPLVVAVLIARGEFRLGFIISSSSRIR